MAFLKFSFSVLLG
jgi:hypothetical protein